MARKEKKEGKKKKKELLKKYTHTHTHTHTHTNTINGDIGLVIFLKQNQGVNIYVWLFLSFFFFLLLPLIKNVSLILFSWIQMVCMCVLLAQSCLTLRDPMDRLLCPWNSPGKNTGVASHSLRWPEVKWSRSVVSNSLQPRGLQPARLLHPWDSPGKNTGVGCHFLLQGIFPT